MYLDNYNNDSRLDVNTLLEFILINKEIACSTNIKMTLGNIFNRYQHYVEKYKLFTGISTYNFLWINDIRNDLVSKVAINNFVIMLSIIIKFKNTEENIKEEIKKII